MMTDPSDPYSMEALVKERALLKLERVTKKRDRLKADLKTRRELIEKRMESEPVIGDPFPDDCVDKLIRNKVLKNILLSLTDPVDVISTYNACSTFQHILETKRKRVLLPEVLKIFLDQKFGFNYKTALREILSLGLVSKSWRNVVDKYLFGEEENTGYRWYFDQNCRDRERDVDYCRTLTLETTAGIHRGISLLSKMSDSDRKLYAGRVLVYLSANSPDRNEFYPGVSEFLERFGDSVWEIYLSLWNLDEVKAYQLMQYWASLMSGLKKLDIRLGYHDYDQLFARRVPILSFPTLPLLTEFHCNKGEFYDPCRIIVFTEIIRANPWILRSSLNLEGYWRNWEHYPVEDCPGPEVLENLPALFKPASMDITGLVLHISLVSWPLKELVLDLGGPEFEYLSLAKLFVCLERFKDTLTHLVIHHFSCNEDNDWPYLDLPNLKTLTMRLNGENPTLDFLLPMKALENLSLYCYQLFSNNKCYTQYCQTMFRFDMTEKIRFKGLLLQMEESNITQAFPFLQKMVIQGWKDDDSDLIQYFRQGDVMKLGKEDENILMDIIQQVGEREIYLENSFVGQVLGS